MGVSVFPTAGFLPGMVLPYAGSAAPSGWLLCDGSLVDRTAYAALYAVVGFSYSPTPGTDPGSNQFYLPNLKGKAIVMQDAAQTEFTPLGQNGGSKSATAAHTHSLSAHTHAPGSHTHTTTIASTSGLATGGDLSNHTHNMELHDHNISHWHLANVANTGWNGTQTHGHHDHGGVGSESPFEGANIPAAAWAVNVDGTAQAGPNGTNRSGWDQNFGGPQIQNQAHSHNHDHGHGSPTSSTPSASNTGAGSPDTTGPSTVGATSGNLQPYLVMNYLIKV